jgi:hypothetical protein
VKLKRLERAWKWFWLRFFYRVVRLTLPRPAPVRWDRDPCRVLFLRPDRIGDSIVTTGIFRAIARGAPNVTIDVVCSPRNLPALRADPHLRTLHVFDRRQWRRIPAFVRSVRSCRYDAGSTAWSRRRP